MLGHQENLCTILPQKGFFGAQSQIDRCLTDGQDLTVQRRVLIEATATIVP